MKTVSGRIDAENVKGSVETETVSGDIELMNISDAMDVKAKVVSGSVVYVGDLKAEGRYFLKTHSGDVKMILPSDSKFDLEANTFSGSISTDFKLDPSATIKKKEIDGVVNGGGAKVDLSAFSGTIKIMKK